MSGTLLAHTLCCKQGTDAQLGFAVAAAAAVVEMADVGEFDVPPAVGGWQSPGSTHHT